jgi:hypothetical protein
MARLLIRLVKMLWAIDLGTLGRGTVRRSDASDIGPVVEPLERRDFVTGS